MNTWLKSTGTFQIGDGAIRIAVDMDFAKYYKALIDKEVRLFTNMPAHGCHITIWNPKIFGPYDQKKAQFLRNFYKNRPISFEYNPDIIEGGQTKNFRNWYMFVRCQEAANMCDHLGISAKRDRLHVTVANTKNGVYPYIWTRNNVQVPKEWQLVR